MNFDEGLKLAFQTVKSNKMRTFLTTLGIVIGVTAVIGMMSIINALDRYMTKSLSSIGGNVFWIQKYPAVQVGHLDQKYRMRKDLKYEHAEAIKRSATLVSAVSAEFFRWGKTVKYKDRATNPNVLVYGGDEYWADVNGRNISEGRMISLMDVQHRRAVAVLGADVAEKLFPFTYPIGEQVKIDGIRYEVIGVMEKMGQAMMGNQDNIVTIPNSTFIKTYGDWGSINIAVKAKSAETILDAMDQVTAILRIARKVPPGDENDFEVVTADSIMNTLRNLTGFIFIAAVIICGISLLVGGIGIMNIMLVSVTERTREIGIRKAVGAKRRHILTQFMTEAVGICLFGGLIGILLGVVVGLLIAQAFKLPPVIPLWSIFVGMGFSLLIGVVFGTYPALKAAKLDPIEALRYE
ncbi:MAG: ABC transporter permease [Candidatus Marinimicrobia bacterium]|mgnify:FL=1|jgi:putative ABC transport system permease protein|nr:ABC transporter permease [Candidatus Neomarinimicrobiota bacterium]HOG75409.1 ABC transporter permease [Candidatus Neomarinimicrobiota bacterium]HPB01019.1 ABC transporter permease [Candidatus Neomarinimicrobiota bacterium]HPI28283.1 ABC transporter permease [Candidatus Neomarinimicrobiota bacterium]HPN75274.1 ABC transporter permease [Candidatus Neomarinimicrobiota bacterium]